MECVVARAAVLMAWMTALAPPAVAQDRGYAKANATDGPPPRSGALAQSDPSGIRPLGSHHVSAEFADRAHAETHIAVDPRDANHLLATSCLIVDGRVRSYPYASFDGGATWTRGQIGGDAVVTSGADPVVYVAPSGTAFFSTLPQVEGASRTVVCRSTDGGRTWNAGVILPYVDRQWMALAPARGLFAARTCLVGTASYTSRDGTFSAAPMLMMSDDDGQTFPIRRLIGRDEGGPDPSAAFSGPPIDPVVSADGNLVLVAWSPPGPDAPPENDAIRHRRFGVLVSDDGGASFGPARYSTTLHTTLTQRDPPERRFRALSAYSFPRAAIDTSSGPHRNRLYVVASHYEQATDRYVVRTWHTSDFGRTWGTAVASDAPSGDVANPAIAVNRYGAVAVLWNDRRDDPQCWHLHAAVSIDGGRTFLPSRRLSEAATCANQPKNWETFVIAYSDTDENGRRRAHLQSGAAIPARWPNGGDTQGLTADAAGVFHAAWINGETGVMQLWHTAFAAAPDLPAPQGGAATPAPVLPTPAGVPEGLADVTADIRFAPTASRLDFEAHTYTISSMIENRSGRSIRGPLYAVMTEFLQQDKAMGLKNIAAANSDNGGRAEGAVWRFEVPGGTLAPGARTAPRELSFTFEGGIPEVPDGYLSPGFSVFGAADN